MTNIERVAEKAILNVIAFFYKPFRKIIPPTFFRYGFSGGANMVFDWILYFSKHMLGKLISFDQSIRQTYFHPVLHVPYALLIYMETSLLPSLFNLKPNSSNTCLFTGT